MARMGRVVCPGLPHHITQRGNRRQQTFFNDGDYRFYLYLMREWSSRCGLSVWAYCLMPNHVHLIVVPTSEDGLRRGIGEAHRRYTERVNRREGWTGHLWQGRFSSFVMDEPYLMAAARYVEMNPVRVGLVAQPEGWPWSSACAHVAGRPDALARFDWLGERTAGWVCSWREYLLRTDEIATSIGRELRRHESTGRPLGDKGFVTKMERALGRSLAPSRRGPKPGSPPGPGTPYSTAAVEYGVPGLAPSLASLGRPLRYSSSSAAERKMRWQSQPPRA